jgi:hypothetical protein
MIMMKFFRSGLFKGLIWQVAGFFVGAGLVTGIRALQGSEWRGTFFFTEPAWVLGALIGALSFLVGCGVMDDWIKWARGIDTHDNHEEHWHGW